MVQNYSDLDCHSFDLDCILLADFLAQRLRLLRLRGDQLGRSGVANIQPYYLDCSQLPGGVLVQ